MNLHSFTRWTYLFACKQVYTDTPFSQHCEESVFKISGVCFKITYLMTNHSPFSLSTVFLIKIVANATLKNCFNFPWKSDYSRYSRFTNDQCSGYVDSVSKKVNIGISFIYPQNPYTSILMNY